MYVCMSVCLPPCQPDCLSFSLPVCLCVCLFVYLCLCPCLSLSLSIRPFLAFVPSPVHQTLVLVCQPLYQAVQSSLFKQQRLSIVYPLNRSTSPIPSLPLPL